MRSNGGTDGSLAQRRTSRLDMDMWFTGLNAPLLISESRKAQIIPCCVGERATINTRPPL
jgi:hypothetical protein